MAENTPLFDSEAQGLKSLVLVTVVAGSEDIALNAGDDMPVNVP